MSSIDLSASGLLRVKAFGLDGPQRSAVDVLAKLEFDRIHKGGMDWDALYTGGVRDLYRAEARPQIAALVAAGFIKAQDERPVSLVDPETTERTEK